MAGQIQMPDDRFEAAYRAGVVEEQSPPPPAAPAPTLPLAEPVALGGAVLAPGGAIADGYVVVDGGETKSVEKTRPEGVRVHETHGVIAPGLIDLHGHPEFNIFAPWEPPKQFINCYAWRGSDIYRQLVRDPQNHLLDVLPPRTQLRYAEIRALVGGVTAIQGTGGAASGYQDEALVRNVDKWIFGSQVGRALIDLPTPGASSGWIRFAASSTGSTPPR
jgi:5-methylthioadenosine/S-adenosylhomocysteine deaminase